MSKKWYNFKNSADDESAELDIFDAISGFWGVNAKEFNDSLREVEGKDLTININSPGGDVFEGHTILNLLLNRKGETTVRIMGLAASIASVIAMAASPGKLRMPVNTAMFLHLPLIREGGNEDELAERIKDLKKIKEGLISAYQRHSSLSREELEQAMRDETLYTAEEAAEVFGAVVEPLTEIAAEFTEDELPEKALAFYNKQPKPGVVPEVKNDKPKGEEKAVSKELEAKITSLEAENNKLIADHKTALEASVNSAVEESKKQEKERRDGITNLVDKYNNNGDLNALALKAVVNGTSASDFKDEILEHIANNRATRTPEKPGEEEHSNKGEVTVEALEKKLEETTDSMEAGRIVNQIRALREKQ